MEAATREPQSGIDLLNKDGTPMKWAVNRWNRNNDMKKRLFSPGALEKLKGPLDLIEKAFVSGDKAKLIAIASNTSRATFQANGFWLGDAQVINSYALGALANLVDSPEYERLEGTLGFQIRSSLGQESGDVGRDRIAKASGAGSAEDQAEARAIVLDRNPTVEELQVRQEAVVGTQQDAVVAEIKALMPALEEVKPFVPAKMTEADWEEEMQQRGAGYTRGGGH